MSNITYHEGNLFDAPKGSLLVHSCNCQGVWGAGIARTFKERNPGIYEAYQKYCDDNGVEQSLGHSVILTASGDPDTVGCLMTSGGGSHSLVDPPDTILKYTDMALTFLEWQMQKFDMVKDKEIHMPQINAGIFKVPWEKTEELLLKHNRLHFNIWVYK